MNKRKVTKEVRINFPREGMIHPRYATYLDMPLSMVDEYQKQILKTSHLAGLFPDINYWVLFDVVAGNRTINYIDDEDNYCVIISELIEEEE